MEAESKHKDTLMNYDPIQRRAERATIDMGLRDFMVRVYTYMALGLALTGMIAFAISQSPALMKGIFGSGLGFVFAFAPMIMVFFISFKIQTMRAETAQLCFWIYSALMGVSISFIFMVYKGASIAQCFFIAASLFGSMSLYGYTTKKDLTSMGSFMIMGLWGIIIASIVNIFLKSSVMQLVVSILSVIIFTGLTAYETQELKSIYNERDDSESYTKKAILGALTLYLNFINIFLSLLRLFGERRN